MERERLKYAFCMTFWELAGFFIKIEGKVAQLEHLLFCWPLFFRPGNCTGNKSIFLSILINRQNSSSNLLSHAKFHRSTFQCKIWFWPLQKEDTNFKFKIAFCLLGYSFAFSCYILPQKPAPPPPHKLNIPAWKLLYNPCVHSVIMPDSRWQHLWVNIRCFSKLLISNMSQLITTEE